MNENKVKNMSINFILSVILFSIPMGIFLIFSTGSLLKGSVCGVISGLLFATGLSMFYVFILLRKGKYKEMYGITRDVLFEADANYKVNGAAAGGWLFFMEDRVIFMSHSFNHVVGRWDFAYSDIGSVGVSKKFRTLYLDMCDGEKEEFLVNDKKKCQKVLNEILGDRL